MVDGAKNSFSATLIQNLFARLGCCLLLLWLSRPPYSKISFFTQFYSTVSLISASTSKQADEWQTTTELRSVAKQIICWRHFHVIEALVKIRAESSSIKHPNHASWSHNKLARDAHARDSSNLMMPKVVDEKLALLLHAALWRWFNLWRMSQACREEKTFMIF